MGQATMGSPVESWQRWSTIIALSVILGWAAWTYIQVERERVGMPGRKYRVKAGNMAHELFKDKAFHKPYKIEWLHIPKCGTTLGETLLTYFCGMDAKGIITRHKVHQDEIPGWCLTKFRTDQPHRKNWILGDHFSLNNYTTEEIKKVYTMIRDPGVRMVSGFHFLTHFKRPNATAEEICNYVLQHQHMGHVALGGQTKFVLGRKVQSPKEGWKFIDTSRPSDSDALHACSILDTMAFVGITDFWETSSCILANSIGKSHTSSSKIRGNPNTIQVKSVDCGDDPDWLLYQCAWNRMAAELEQYSICKRIFWAEFTNHRGV